MASCLSCGFDAAPDLEQCPQCGASLRDPLIGAVLGDRYRILSRIGVGGMGAVYRALHTSLKREVAIKVLLPDFGGKEEFVRRFEREAESASRLAHPNIIAVTDFGRTPEHLLFLAMEFLDGQSLASLIKQGPLDLPRALAIFRQILAGLGHAHVAGIVHRDLKPDNIMLVERHGRPDVVKILDFGIAKITDGALSGEALTQAGVIFGTPEYLSPEQALGDVVDARADLYAAGVILFEMLTSRRPFESDEKVRIISMHLSHPPPRLSEVNPVVQIPPAIEEVVMQALEKQREHRFASSAAFLAALEDAEAVAVPGVAPASPPATAATPDGRTGGPALALPARGWLRSRRHWAAAGAAAVILTTAAFAFIPRRSGRSRTVATGSVT
ncbi:MAG: serine/threonine-protein kinase, partial [Pseudomonadota bacterium]